MGTICGYIANYFTLSYIAWINLNYHLFPFHLSWFIDTIVVIMSDCCNTLAWRAEWKSQKLPLILIFTGIFGTIRATSGANIFQQDHTTFVISNIDIIRIHGWHHTKSYDALNNSFVHDSYWNLSIYFTNPLLVSQKSMALSWKYGSLSLERGECIISLPAK